MGGMSELHATGAKELQAVQQPQQGTMVIDALLRLLYRNKASMTMVPQRRS